MPQQTQKTQPWQEKTIKQAITDCEEQIYLKLGGKLYFMIENEINETENNGEFNFSLTSPFITSILNCRDETTIQEVCQKVINHVFAYAVKHITQTCKPEMPPIKKVNHLRNMRSGNRNNPHLQKHLSLD